MKMKKLTSSQQSGASFKGLPPQTAFSRPEIEVIYDALLFRPSVIGRLGTRHKLHPQLRYRLKELSDGLEEHTTYDMYLPLDEVVAGVIPYALQYCEFFKHNLHEMDPELYYEAKESLESMYLVEIPW